MCGRLEKTPRVVDANEKNDISCELRRSATGGHQQLKQHGGGVRKAEIEQKNSMASTNEQTKLLEESRQRNYDGFRSIHRLLA